MDCISFDALRTLKIPNVRYIKPEHANRNLEDISKADWLLFPQYWRIGALNFTLHKRIFPSFESYFLGHDKVEMTRAFEALVPANTPWTIIEANTNEGAERVWDQMPLPFVAKIPRSSMGFGVFLIETRAQWREYLEQTDVIYAQELLPIDRDLRIIIVGDEVISGFWRLQSPDGFHNNVTQGGQVATGIIPPAAIDLALKVAKELNINHAGFDIAMVGDHPYIFEFNRLFGNKGLPDIEMKVAQAIERYLLSNGNDHPLNPTPPLHIAV